jgi:hypothetical protein
LSVCDIFLKKLVQTVRDRILEVEYIFHVFIVFVSGKYDIFSYMFQYLKFILVQMNIKKTLYRAMNVKKTFPAFYCLLFFHELYTIFFNHAFSVHTDLTRSIARSTSRTLRARKAKGLVVCT